MSQVLPLNLLATGESGQILDVSGEESLVRHLGELGFRPGVEIRMVQSGAPCIVAVDHQRYSIRADEETMVLVEVARP